MPKRIKVGSRVSTEAWQCDAQPITSACKEEDRWSYMMFGRTWRDERVIGTVEERNGDMWTIKFDVDGQKVRFHSSKLQLLDDGTKLQTILLKPLSPLSSDNDTTVSVTDAINTTEAVIVTNEIVTTSSDSQVVPVLTTAPENATTEATSATDIASVATTADDTPVPETSTATITATENADFSRSVDVVTADVAPETVSSEAADTGTTATNEEAKNPMLPPCGCKLRKCDTKVSEQQREIMHGFFWKLNYKDRKQWIYSNVGESAPSRRYASNNNDNPKRKTTRTYWMATTLGTEQNKVQVCQTMFLNTLGLKTDKAIVSALKNAEFDMVAPDRRGKNPKSHSIPAEDDEFLKSHIMSFNPALPHYRREHAPNRLYLSNEITIIEMYNDYVHECEEKGRKKYSYAKYWSKVRELKISFVKLGIEECEVCEEHKVHLELDNGEVNEDVETELSQRNETDKLKRKRGVSVKSNKKEKLTQRCKDDGCQQCAQYHDHVRAYRETRNAYRSEENVDDTMKMSVDMQKVILLPRLPTFKRCLFTKRVVTINQSFVPIGSVSGNGIGVLWHEGLAGRKDEDVTSAFMKVIGLPEFRDIKYWVFWLDNCAGQNKCWTLYTAFVNVVNQIDGPEAVTLNYFVAGHTFMSADNFHHEIEKEMKEMGRVGDFLDFVHCVKKAGEAVVMDIADFHNHEHGLSQGQISKESRPLLENVSIVEFRRGSQSMFYKKTHTAEEFMEADFLKNKIKKQIAEIKYVAPRKYLLPRGVPADKKRHIIEKLGPLIGARRLKFYEELVESDVVDLVDNYE